MPILVLQSSLIGKRELVALLSLSSWCLVIDVWLFFAVPWVCLQFVIVVFPDHTILDEQKISAKNLNIFLPIVSTCILGAQKN